MRTPMSPTPHSPFSTGSGSGGRGGLAGPASPGGAGTAKSDESSNLNTVSATLHRLSWAQCVGIACTLALVIAGGITTALLVRSAANEDRFARRAQLVEEQLASAASGIFASLHSQEEQLLNLGRQVGNYYADTVLKSSEPLVPVFDASFATIVGEAGTNSMLLLGAGARVLHSERTAFEAVMTKQLNQTSFIFRSDENGIGIMPPAGTYAPVTVSRPPLAPGIEMLDLAATETMLALLDVNSNSSYSGLSVLKWNSGDFHVGVLPFYAPSAAVRAAFDNIKLPRPAVKWEYSPADRATRHARLRGWLFAVFNATELVLPHAVPLTRSGMRVEIVDVPPTAAGSAATTGSLSPKAVVLSNTVPSWAGCRGDEDVTNVYIFNDGPALCGVASEEEAVTAARSIEAGGSTLVIRVEAPPGTFDVAHDDTTQVVMAVAVTILVCVLWMALVYSMLAAGRAREEQLERVAAVKMQQGHEATMSYACHELRNPLHVASCSFDFIMERSASLPSEVAEDVRHAASAIASMRMLIDDILDLSKLRSGGFAVHPQRTDVHALSTRVASEHRTFAIVPVSCSIDEDVPQETVTDGLRLRQILNNGMSNAAKLTSAGVIRLHVGVRDVPSAGAERATDSSSTGLGKMIRSFGSPKQSASTGTGSHVPHEGVLVSTTPSATSAAARAVSPVAGAVALSVRSPSDPGVYTPRQRQLVFTISDSGPGLGGIDPETLFQPYRQGVAHNDAKRAARGGANTTAAFGPGRSDERAMRGTGLGLSICRLLARALGGDVILRDRFEDDPGSTASPPAKVLAGADFVVTLPFKAPPSSPRTATAARELARRGTQSSRYLRQGSDVAGAPKRHPSTSSRRGDPIHVLIVDDMSSNRRLGRRMVRSIGWSCDILEDGDQVVDFIKASFPSTIRIDEAASDEKAAPTKRTTKRRLRAQRSVTPSDEADGSDCSGSGSDGRPGTASEIGITMDGEAVAAAAAATADAAAARAQTRTGEQDAKATDSTQRRRRGSDKSSPDSSHPVELDAIILDIVMERMSGTEVCLELRKKYGVDIPIIAATGNAGERDLDTYEKAGFSAVLHKPFNMSALKRVVGSLIDEYRAPAVDEEPKRSVTRLKPIRSTQRLGTIASTGGEDEGGAKVPPIQLGRPVLGPIVSDKGKKADKR